MMPGKVIAPLSPLFYSHSGSYMYTCLFFYILHIGGRRAGLRGGAWKRGAQISFKEGHVASVLSHVD